MLNPAFGLPWRDSPCDMRDAAKRGASRGGNAARIESV